MLPLIVGAIGAIGAVVSAIKGGSWVSDQIGAAKSGASVGGKTAGTSQTDAAAAPFAAALAAQAAGQTLPTSSSGVVAATGSAAPSTPAVLPIHSSQYDVLARVNAGIAAYNKVGQHQATHAGAIAASVTQS